MSLFTSRQSTICIQIALLACLFCAIGAPAILADSTNVEIGDSTTYPSSYDAKVLDRMNEAPSSDFTVPLLTVLKPVPTNLCAHDCKAAFVWLKVRLDNSNAVTESQVVYCSAPNDGFEEVAQRVVVSQKFNCPEMGKSCDRWLYHEIFFTGDQSLPACDSSGYPRPDEFIPVEKVPEMVYMARPEYPQAAKVLGITGTVWVKSLVDRSGSVKVALVSKSSGSSLLDNAAVRSAWVCRYTPALINGAAVALWVTYKIDFKLNH